MSNLSCNIAVIGGGVVGCSIARELAERFDDILLIEKEPSVGMHTSGRNSGVIHSGINAKPGSLKARLCVEGNGLLQDYCQKNDVPVEKVGTLVVATTEQEIPVLDELKRRAEKNGVPGVLKVSQKNLRDYEPHARGLAGLFSPSAAIVDSMRLTQSLAEQAKKKGVRLLFDDTVEGLEEAHDGICIQTRNGSISAERVINCAGLHADRLAHSMNVGRQYSIVPFRGEYFVVDRADPPLVRSMIYPVPDLRFPFLGVHLTRMVGGMVLVGPNAVPAFGREAYFSRDIRIKDLVEMVFHRGFWNALLKNRKLMHLAWREIRNSCSRPYFWREANRLVEGLRPEDLRLSTRVGIRAQLIRSDGELVDDMVIETTSRTIHILNVVSPGMTCSVAFARWLTSQLDAAVDGKDSHRNSRHEKT